MAAEYKGQTPLDIAKQAEQDLNSYENVHGTDPNTRAKPKNGVTVSDSAWESGVDDGAAQKFPGGSVTYGSAASGAGNNRDIPEHEGGGINPATGRSYKAGDFERGVGAPEKRDASYSARHGGEPDADAPVRQGQGQTGAK
ncbi:hypothetical protein B5807_11374 [Epicoccum nigrum]|uniref:Uncharacterized protein n=1 Tax=Epicoccum nigrum TaxID=105696 RepID=A0A1Y2LK79_EPING|nr:hypothetical protein B5807_11374 [Epicoccum nigrum]